MRSLVKEIIRQISRFIVRSTCGTRLGSFIFDQMRFAVMEEAVERRHNGISLFFAVPNWLCRWRADTFSTKEPETLAWIDGLEKGAVLWDVGANVGLYSIYAAQQRKCVVFAFEPSVFNLELLARNIFLNHLTARVCIVPLALSNKSGASIMRMTTAELGGALSTFGETYGYDGKAIRQVFEFQTIGLSADEACARLGIPTADYLKVDVDGIEHLILSGAREVLEHVKEVLVEVNDDFAEQAEQVATHLRKAGLVLKEKRCSEIISGSKAGFANTSNQIWVRR